MKSLIIICNEVQKDPHIGAIQLWYLTVLRDVLHFVLSKQTFNPKGYQLISGLFSFILLPLTMYETDV
jgi:hypothetical protein